MEQRTIFAGAAVLIGVLLVVAVFGTGDDGPEMQDVVAEEMAPVSEAMAALNERVAAVESSLDGVSEQASSAATAEDLAPLSETMAALGDRITAVESSLDGMSEQIASAASAEDLAAVETQVQSVLTEAGTLRESLDGVQETLAETVETVEAVTTQPAPVVSVAPVADEPVTTDTAVVDVGAETFGPGTTALFADGALRLFVSRVDADAGEARVSVAGQMKTMSEGGSQMFAAGTEYCRVMVDAITTSGVAFSSLCGDELPDPEGISAGETAILADGAVRVFASLIEESAARLSINGDIATVALDRSVPVMAGEESCRVYLDGLDRGHAMVNALCGADVSVSAPAGPGQTVTLAEGAARIFVAAVQDDSARFAVNGQNVISGEAGEAVVLEDGCAVTVEDIIDGAASFSYACTQ